MIKRGAIHFSDYDRDVHHTDIPLPVRNSLPQTMCSKSRVSKLPHEESANPHNLPSLKKGCPCGNGGV